MDDDRIARSRELRRLVNGYQVTQALHALVELGIPDQLAAGPRGVDDLATATGCREASLYRLLRAVASVGVLREEPGRRFGLTPLGEGLRSDDPMSLAGWTSLVGEPYYWDAWPGLAESVRTGEPAFLRLHGVDPWDYRRRDAAASAIFDRAMGSLARQNGEAVAAAFDFCRFPVLVDVGGGNGTFLATLLRRCPASRGILFDLPHVVAGAGPVLTGAEVADRCEVVGGSFFEQVPAGGDAYLLKAILHDWDDERSVALLRVCRAAMREGAALLVVEQDLGQPNADPLPKFSDLNMLAIPGGRERTADEYAALFAAAGFRYAGTTPSATDVAVFAGTAV